MKTKLVVPALAAAVGGFFLYKHFAAQKAHAAATSAAVAANSAQAAGVAPAPSTMNGLGGSPFSSHLAPMRNPAAFWSAGGWVGDTVVKSSGRNYNVSPQVAPNIVDAYIGAGGVAVVGQAPPGAQTVKVLIDNSGTVLQVLRSQWKTSDNVAGLGALKFNLNKVAKSATAVTKKPTIASLKQATSLALPKAHADLLKNPTVVHNIAAAVATTGAAHLVGSHITVAGTLQAGPGAKEVTALTDAQGHVLATYATKSGQTAHAGWTSFQSTPGTPSTELSGLGTLGFSLSKAISAVAQTVAAPLKITVATLKTTVAPAAALVTLVKTGSVSAATSTLKTDLTAIPTAGKSIASNLISTAKQATAVTAKPAATGVTAQTSPVAAAGTLPGDPIGAQWPVDPTTASGWPGVWTNVPTGAAGWQYGDVGDGTGDGLLQNIGLQVSFTATPAMISAAGGNPALVVSNYTAQNPTAIPTTGTINPVTGMPYSTTTSTPGSAQSYGWPAYWTPVPNNTAYQYMAAQDGTGNGSFMNPSTGQTYTAVPSQIQMYSGIPASVLASLLGAAGTTATGSAQSYGWPAYWTSVPTNTTWQYMAAQDGTGNGTFQNSSTGQSFTATPAMIAAAYGSADSVLANYLGTSASTLPAGYDGGYGDPDTGSGLTAPEVDANGNPIDPNTGLPETGVDANGNPISAPGAGMGPNGSTMPATPTPVPAPAKSVNWFVAGGAALAIPAFMWFKK